VGGWGCAPDPTGGACSTHPDTVARLRALLLKGREGGGEGREGERKWQPPTFWEKVTPLVVNNG